MQEIFQQTIKNPVSFEGIGLHSGKICKVKLIPSDVDKGIIFKRTDLSERNVITANFNKKTPLRIKFEVDYMWDEKAYFPYQTPVTNKDCGGFHQATVGFEYHSYDKFFATKGHQFSLDSLIQFNPFFSIKTFLNFTFPFCIFICMSFNYA